MSKTPTSTTDIIEIIDPNLRAGFTQVPRLILRAKGLSNTAKLVYALLLDYAWQQGSCFPGQQQLAQDLDTTERTIQRALTELRDYHLIAWQRRGLRQTNVYSILSLADNPNLTRSEADTTKMSPLDTTKMSGQDTTKMSHRIYSREYTQGKYKSSSIREESSQKNEETREPAQGSTQPLAAQPTVSYEEFSTIRTATEQHPQHQASREEAPQQSPPAQSPGLNRQYFREARAKLQQQPTQGTALASVFPTPPHQPPKRTYTEERQVLVDLLSDLAREFRDEAKLTESVSRAYNLMQGAKISDIGVFTSKIYEARSITKERYGTIKRRMPYFFSVLADVCELRPKPSGQTADSAQQT
jgi:hypothetical protein